MGLAAGQARLLTITGRKSDCEFQSMRLSHQKIALARDLAALSNEYQNSLTQTKLIYDYYGTGDESNPLSYGLMMKPSTLNNYMPILLTDSMNRVVLDSKYAAAARAAGIPQEGLGTLPSDLMRNNFIKGLATAGLITDSMSTTLQGIPYNQAAGMGGGVTVAVNTTDGVFDEFMEYLKTIGTSYSMNENNFPKQSRTNAKGDSAESVIHVAQKKGDDFKDGHNNGINNINFTLASLLDVNNENYAEYYLDYEGIRGEQSPVYGVALMQEILLDNGFVDWIYDELSEALDLGDGFSGKALEYAYTMVTDMIRKDDTNSWDGKTGYEYWRAKDDGKATDECTQFKKNEVYDYLSPIGTNVNGYTKHGTSKDESYQSDVTQNSKDYIGFYFVGSNKGGGDDGNDHATGAINLNNIAKAFLTYFADFMNGVAKTDIYGNELFNVEVGKNTLSRLAPDDNVFEYTWRVGTDVSSDALGQATFYDALFNQICANGWVENNNVNDNEYLQHMLQNGMMFLTSVKDDGYYYQGNYSTHTYVKEVADESKIAQAEAKYNTEKAKLNAKEETLDLKMKNLDTEISSLTTEYDTVKNTIAKQIEKTFKRYA